MESSKSSQGDVCSSINGSTTVSSDTDCSGYEKTSGEYVEIAHRN
jgi:hypothetical protein